MVVDLIERIDLGILRSNDHELPPPYRFVEIIVNSHINCPQLIECGTLLVGVLCSLVNGQSTVNDAEATNYIVPPLSYMLKYLQ